MVSLITEPFRNALAKNKLHFGASSSVKSDFPINKPKLNRIYIKCLSDDSDSHIPHQKTPEDPCRTLLIDNYDSYTYNLFHLLSQVNGGIYSLFLYLSADFLRQIHFFNIRKISVEPLVIANNEFSWQEVKKWLDQENPQFDSVVISPGPGTPENPRDIGRSS